MTDLVRITKTENPARRGLNRHRHGLSAIHAAQRSIGGMSIAGVVISRSDGLLTNTAHELIHSQNSRSL